MKGGGEVKQSKCNFLNMMTGISALAAKALI